jgi:hypothetical protein
VTASLFKRKPEYAFGRSVEVVMVVEGWRQGGHHEGTSLRDDAGYDEKC